MPDAVLVPNMWPAWAMLFPIDFAEWDWHRDSVVPSGTWTSLAPRDTAAPVDSSGMPLFYSDRKKAYTIIEQIEVEKNPYANAIRTLTWHRHVAPDCVALAAFAAAACSP